MYRMRNLDTASKIAIEMQEVGKTFGTGESAVEAVQNVSCNIADGEFLSVVGPSGCGKSSLLMLVAGLSNPSHGEIRIFGTPVWEPYTKLGIAFQDACLLPWRSALENVMLQAEIRKSDKSTARADALKLLRQVGLSGFENKYPSELSGGMAQRVALCRAMLHDPSIILMDEPFGALDALTRDQMQLDLQDIWMSNQKTVVLVTHSIEEAAFLGDRVLVMSKRPTTVQEEVCVPFTRPRNTSVRSDPEFVAITDRIRGVLTNIGAFDDKAY